MFIILLPETLTTVADAVFGQYLRAQFGLNLKYGVVEVTAAEHVAVSNHQKVADQDHMPVELFV
jgi:hypothetical protein